MVSLNAGTSTIAGFALQRDSSFFLVEKGKRKKAPTSAPAPPAHCDARGDGMRRT